jgi:hypothetical protein
MIRSSRAISNFSGLKCLTALALGVFLSAEAPGGVVIGDIPSSNNGGAFISGTTGVAQGFRMTGNYSNLSTTFELVNSAAASLPGSGLGIGLYQDSGNFPTGSALVTFNLGTAIATGDAVYTAAANNSAFQLNASTTYWLILNYPAATDLSWVTETAVTPSGPGATNVGQRNTGTMSSSTQVAPNGFSVTTLTPNFSTKFEVDGTPVVVGAVPEPGTVLLAALGLCGIALLPGLKTRFSRR